MPTPASAQPALYNAPASGTPPLKGQKCTVCGHISFPAQPYGCERCGAYGDAIEEMNLAARGTLHSFSRVLRHQGKGIEPPFVIGEIRLSDGPFIRIALDRTDTDGLAIGQQMEGCLVPAHTKDGTEVRELRFTVAKDGG